MGKKRDRTIGQLNETIEGLRRELLHFIERHHADTATIGQRLIEEAERHDCGARYDEIVAELNKNLAVPLPLRPRPFTVYATVELRVDVTAVDEADARDEAYPLVLKAEAELDALPGVTSFADRDSVNYQVSPR